MSRKWEDDIDNGYICFTAYENAVHINNEWECSDLSLRNKDLVKIRDLLNRRIAEIEAEQAKE